MRDSTWRVVNAIGNTLLSPPREAFGHYHNQGPAEPLRVALTFDDGPSSPSTERLLDLLDETATPATFFCVGEMVHEHPGIVRRAHEAGHEIGNHSMTHGRGAALHPFDASAIDDANDVIAVVTGTQPTLYRPPWGWLTPWAASRARDRGMTCIGWDVYPDDWKLPEEPGQRIVEQVLRDVRPGSIVLLHDGRAGDPACAKQVTVDAVRELIPTVRSWGWEFVTVSTLLGLDRADTDRAATR